MKLVLGLHLSVGLFGSCFSLLSCLQKKTKGKEDKALLNLISGQEELP